MVKEVFYRKAQIRLNGCCTHVRCVCNTACGRGTAARVSQIFFFFFNLKIWSPKEQPQPIIVLLLRFHRSSSSYSSLPLVLYLPFVLFWLFRCSCLVSPLVYHLSIPFSFVAWARDKALELSDLSSLGPFSQAQFDILITHTRTHNLCLLFHYHIIVLMF